MEVLVPKENLLPGMEKELKEQLTVMFPSDKVKVTKLEWVAEGIKVYLSQEGDNGEE